MATDAAPRDPTERAAYHERQAALARLDAARQAMAVLTETQRQDEQRRIAAGVAAERRERERVAESMASMDHALAAANAAVGRQRARELARELAETSAQLEARVASRLLNIEARVDMKLPLTVGEHALLEQYGGARWSIVPRPTKYSATTADRILSCLRVGNTRMASACYAGIDYSTLKRWAERNAEFCAALDHAEAEAEVYCVAIVRKAISEGDTSSAKWWLERRRHEDWRQHDTVDVEVYIRARAAELGLDVDEALAAASHIINGRPR